MKLDDQMIDLFCSVRDRSEMKQLMTEIFTSAECDDLTLRWKLLRFLSEGKTQREIAKELHISLCKITRGAKILKDEKSLLGKYFSKDKKK